MEKIILIISIICFIQSAFWLAAKVTGNVASHILAKSMGIAGTVLPLIYWLKIGGVI